MSNETNKPIEAQELTEKELEGVVGGLKAHRAERVVREVPGGGAALAVAVGSVLSAPCEALRAVGS